MFSLSYLLYSVTNWGNAAKRLIQKIQVLQNRLIKIISNTFKFKTKLLPLYQELNILKFHNIYRLEVIKFMNRHKNGKLPALYDSYFILTSKVHDHMTRQASKNNFFMRRVTNRQPNNL